MTMNGHTWEMTLEELRADHRVEIENLATGSRWVCSCGREGTGFGAYSNAVTASDQHLRAAHRRIIAQHGKG